MIAFWTWILCKLLWKIPNIMVLKTQLFTLLHLVFKTISFITDKLYTTEFWMKHKTSLNLFTDLFYLILFIYVWGISLYLSTFSAFVSVSAHLSLSHVYVYVCVWCVWTWAMKQSPAICMHSKCFKHLDTSQGPLKWHFILILIFFPSLYNFSQRHIATIWSFTTINILLLDLSLLLISPLKLRFLFSTTTYLFDYSKIIKS